MVLSDLILLNFYFVDEDGLYTVYGFARGAVSSINSSVSPLNESILSAQESTKSLNWSFNSLPFALSFRRVAVPLSGAIRHPIAIPIANPVKNLFIRLGFNLLRISLY